MVYYVCLAIVLFLKTRLMIHLLQMPCNTILWHSFDDLRRWECEAHQGVESSFRVFIFAPIIPLGLSILLALYIQMPEAVVFVCGFALALEMESLFLYALARLLIKLFVWSELRTIRCHLLRDNGFIDIKT